MPLLSGSGQATISKNISIERHAGKPEQQAIAIAERKARGDGDPSRKELSGMLDSLVRSVATFSDRCDAAYTRMDALTK
jgi:hypothetical protein